MSDKSQSYYETYPIHSAHASSIEHFHTFLKMIRVYKKRHLVHSFIITDFIDNKCFQIYMTINSLYRVEATLHFQISEMYGKCVDHVRVMLDLDDRLGYYKISYEPMYSNTHWHAIKTIILGDENG